MLKSEYTSSSRDSSRPVAELLKTAREAGKAWGAEEGEAGSEAYLEFAEQHLARAMAKRGVLGFQDLLQKELNP